MNKDRAIQMLERMQDPEPYEPQITSEAFDALQMAIEALKYSEVPNSSDTISRQAAIDIVVFECGKWIGLAKEISKQLKQLPSAQPERAIKDCRNCKFGDYNDHWNTNFCYCSGDCNNWDKWEPSAQPEPANSLTKSGMISKQKVMYKLTALVNEIEEIFANIREREVDDSVCGLCEYDGAYIGQSGDWCNECPGFEKDNCFKLKDKYRTEWESIDE